MKAEEEQRLDDFLRVLVSMTDGDFGPRIPLLGDDSPCEAVAAAINILADELQAREEQQEGLHMGRVRDVLEATPDVIAIADTNRHIVFMNRAARRVLKIPPGEDPKGSNLSRMFTPRGGSVFLTQALPEALRTHQWTGEIALQDREGTPIPVSMVVLAHHDHHGRHDYLATIGRDISDLKALEQE
ncbi:MAG: PAS domain-containing protein, partial [Myxococcales bacterium]|nr:PAS domain-containing protein [Myxococcales bacterium]